MVVPAPGRVVSEPGPTQACGIFLMGRQMVYKLVIHPALSGVDAHHVLVCLVMGLVLGARGCPRQVPAFWNVRPCKGAASLITVCRAVSTGSRQPELGRQGRGASGRRCL